MNKEIESTNFAKNLRIKANKIAQYLLRSSNIEMNEEELDRLQSTVHFHLSQEDRMQDKVIPFFLGQGIAMSFVLALVWTMFDPVPFYEGMLTVYWNAKLNYSITTNATETLLKEDSFFLFWFASVSILGAVLTLKNIPFMVGRLLKKSEYKEKIRDAFEEQASMRHVPSLEDDVSLKRKNRYILDNLIKNKFEKLLSDPSAFIVGGYLIVMYIFLRMFGFVGLIYDSNLDFSHILTVFLFIRTIAILSVIPYIYVLISREYIYRRFPLSRLFSRILKSIVILKNPYLGIDITERNNLIRNLEEAAVIFERYPGLVSSSTDFEYFLFNSECKKIALMFREFKFWVVHPKSDTYVFLRAKLSSNLISLLTDDWHSLSKVSEDINLKKTMSFKDKTILEFRRYITILFKASLPIFLLLMFQQTPFRFQGENLDYITIGSFLFATLVLLLEFDPKYLDYLRNFSAFVKDLRGK